MLNKLFVICSKCICSYLLMFLAVSPSFADDHIIRLTAGDYPPYQSHKLKHFGVISRIVTEAFALEGVKVEFTFMPWKRAYNVILRGELDGVGYATRKKERIEHFYFSDPVFQKQRVFFYLKSDTFDWKEVKDLSGLKIGAMRGYAYNDAFDQADKSGLIDTHRVSTHEQNMRMLVADRVDLALSTLDQGLYALQMSEPDTIPRVAWHPKPLHSPSMYLMLSKKVAKNELMIERFNRGLKKLKESGLYDQFFRESQRGDYILN